MLHALQPRNCSIIGIRQQHPVTAILETQQSVTEEQDIVRFYFNGGKSSRVDFHSRTARLLRQLNSMWRRFNQWIENWQSVSRILLARNHWLLKLERPDWITVFMSSTPPSERLKKNAVFS
jgi:hypothetical protein